MREFDETPAPVLSGIDVLEADEFRSFSGRIGLIADHTSRALGGRATIDVLLHRDELFLDRVFLIDTEMGGGAAQEIAVRHIGPDRERLTPEAVSDLEALVIDLQEPGCRLSPHAAILVDALNACAEAGLRLYVLDRPNPLDGLTVEGPSSERSAEANFARFPLPLRHGMTIGELARLIRSSDDIDVDLRVVKMIGWQRQYLFEHTGQRWVAPLAGLDDLESAVLYAGLGLLADTNVSLGIGSGEPYHTVQAPWIVGADLARAVAARGTEGATVAATPTGIRFSNVDLQTLSPPHAALAVIEALRALYPTQWDFNKLATRLARADLLDAIEDRAEQLDDLWVPDPDFFETRAQVLLY